MDEKQRKSFDRSIQRAVARSGNDEDEKLCLFIRVATSKIYNGKPVYKALLKEVIYMRMTDLHENDLRVPKGTPWSKDYRKYEGWCFARQEYLAGRVGCQPTYASKALKKIIKDGYLKTRRYRGKDGAWHKQYFPDEAFIDAKIAELEASADKSTDKSVATPTCTNDSSPLALSATAHQQLVQLGTCTNDNSPLALSARKGGSLGLSFEVGVGSTHFSTPPSASPSGIADCYPSSNQEKNKTNPAGALSSQAKTKAKPKATPPRCGNPDCLELLIPGEEHVCWEEGTAKVKAAIVGFDVEEA